MQEFDRLLGIMARLRAPGGCPWDREQDHRSIRKYLIEEAYEVAEAIDREDPRELCTELGDLLLQVVFHAQMASERGAFAADDVCRAISDKMERRHPHVFGDTSVSGSGEVLRNWERIKADERGPGASAIDGVPRALPSLQRAERTGEKAEPVHQRPVLGEPEQARLRVAGLCEGRDGTQFGEAEAQRRPEVRCDSVLVETGRESDRMGETQPEDPAFEPPRRRRLRLDREQREHLARQLRRADGPLVRTLRVEQEQRASQQRVEGVHPSASSTSS